VDELVGEDVVEQRRAVAAFQVAAEQEPLGVARRAGEQVTQADRTEVLAPGRRLALQELCEVRPDLEVQGQRPTAQAGPSAIAAPTASETTALVIDRRSTRADGAPKSWTRTSSPRETTRVLIRRPADLAAARRSTTRANRDGLWRRITARPMLLSYTGAGDVPPMIEE